MTKKVNIPRLKKLITALQDAKPENFSMRMYGRRSCSTPACVLGHYAYRRDLQRTLTLTSVEDDPERLWLRDAHGQGIGYDDRAVLDHFGICEWDADKLFNGISGCGGATTTKQAIAYIRKFIARREREAKS